MNLKRYEDAGKVIQYLRDHANDDLYANMLNNMCWAVYKASNKKDTKIPEELMRIAPEASKRSIELIPDDTTKWDTQAHLMEALGDLEGAIKLETRAMEHEQDPTEKNNFRKAIQALKARETQR